MLEQEVLGAMVIPGAWQHSVLLTVDLVSDAGVWLKGRSESIFPKKNYIQASHFWDCKDIIYAVFFFFWPRGTCNLSPPPGMESVPPALEVQSLNH